MSCIGQQGGKLILKVIPLISLTDKVQHSEAFLTLRKPQATPQLLKEDSRGLGGTQEQHRIDLRDVHALVVDVYHKDEANLAADQFPFGVFLSSSEDFPVKKMDGIPWSLK